MIRVMWGAVGVTIGVWAVYCARSDIARQRRCGVVFAEFHSVDHAMSWVTSVMISTVCAVVAHRVHVSAAYVAMCCVLVGTGLRMSWVDIDTHTIPRRVLWQSTCVAAPVALYVVAQADDVAAFDVILSVVLMWVILRVIEFASRGQLGHADVLCAAYTGLFIGAVNLGAVWVAIVAAFIAAGLVALVLLVFRLSSRHSHIPFGPFLFFGAMYVVLR